jgi:hypothetical protein
LPQLGVPDAGAHDRLLRVETGNRRNRAALDPTRIGIKRDDALVSLNADLDQNIDPEVTQRGRNLDA